MVVASPTNSAGRVSVAVALAIAAASRLDGQRPGACDASCTFQLQGLNNETNHYDLRSLCNTTHDYLINDTQGHSYFANVCGTTTQNCAPPTWMAQYEYGSMVQLWGDTPSCDTKQCANVYTGAPECCTADCEVFAIPTSFVPPNVTYLNASSPGAGIRLALTAAQQPFQDPFQCDYVNPETGAYCMYIQLCGSIRDCVL